jgi:hypothetical protein
MLALASEADLTGPEMLALSQEGRVKVRHAIGAIYWPSGEPVAEIREEGETLLVRGEDGAERRMYSKLVFSPEPSLTLSRSASGRAQPLPGCARRRAGGPGGLDLAARPYSE